MAIGNHISTTAAREAAKRAAAMLSADQRVQLVFLFGSITDPGRKHVGDVDLAIFTEPALTLDELMRVRADVVSATHVPVDFVSLNQVPVVLGWEIAESGECLFARTPDAEAEFVIRARARFFDFKPFLDDQWQLSGERLKERERGS